MRHSPALVVIVLAAGAAASAWAQDAERPIVSFAGTEPLEMTWTGLKKGERVEIVNESTSGLDLTVSVTAFRASGRRLPAPQVVAFQRPPAAGTEKPPFALAVTIPAGDSVSVTLESAEGAEAAPGTYRSSIVAFAPHGQAFARRSIVLTVEPVTALAEPIVDKLSAKAYRKRGADWDRYPAPDDLQLPLKPSESKITPPAKKRLGTISNGSTVATITYHDVIKDSDGTVVALALDVDGLGGAGEYEGKLDLLPDDDKKGEITLKVVYADAIWLPLLVLALGLLVGHWVSRQVGVVVRYLDLRARVARLGQALEDAQAAFSDRAKGKTWSRYRIAPAVHAAQTELNDRVDDLRAAHSVQIPDEESQKVIDKIDELRGQITPFGPFALKLAAVEDMRDEIVGAPPEPLQRGHWDPEPEILARVRRGSEAE